MKENSPSFTLIVPAAADKAEAPGTLPEIFGFDRDGLMLCVKAVQGLNLSSFTKIYFTVLRKHVEAFDIDTLLNLQFKRAGLQNAEIITLDTPTGSQPETIARTIEQAGIEGPIFIKDADSHFTAEIYPENGVAVFPLEQMKLIDPRNKSYVAVDDMRHVTNIIEKRIVSNLFSVGGYSFEDAALFMKAYDDNKHLGPLYLSHLIYYLLLSGETFRPISASDYIDLELRG